MGLFDGLGASLKGALNEAESAAVPGLISSVLAKTNLGDLQGLAEKLRQGGLGDQVNSWLGDGKNLPISADQLRAVLSNSQVQELARHFGLPVDEALKLLAQHLPTAVDQASPNGTIEPTPEPQQS